MAEEKNINEKELEQEVVEEAQDVSNDETNIDDLQQKCEEYLDGWKRAQADYANLQRQVADGRQEMREQAKIEVAQLFLPVAMNLETAMKHIPKEKNEDSWVVGMEHILKQFQEALEHLGLERIKTEGALFDPQLHDAIGKEKEEGAESDMIIRETAPGYMLNGKVIIPAKVIVAE